MKRCMRNRNFISKYCLLKIFQYNLLIFHTFTNFSKEEKINYVLGKLPVIFKKF